MVVCGCVLVRVSLTMSRRRMVEREARGVARGAVRKSRRRSQPNGNGGEWGPSEGPSVVRHPDLDNVMYDPAKTGGEQKPCDASMRLSGAGTSNLALVRDTISGDGQQTQQRGSKRDPLASAATDS